MNSHHSIKLRLDKRRHKLNVERKRYKKDERRREAEAFSAKKLNSREWRKKQTEHLEEMLGGELTYERVLKKWLPTNLKYLIFTENSDFYKDLLPKFGEPRAALIMKKKVLYVPEIFSLIDNPQISYNFIREATSELLFGRNYTVDFSYERCKRLDIGAQVVLDIIIKEVIWFVLFCSKNRILKSKWELVLKGIGLTGKKNTSEQILKILYSVGSLALHADKKIDFPDIVPYRLCVHSREREFDYLRAIEQKELDVTNMVDYVLDSLARVKRGLSPERIDDLCKIIGEVLINAEEHATTSSRFSIGYFQEKTENGKHYGLFRLVILNFGKTIYEKFSDPDCQNKSVVNQMRQLSKKYTSEGMFVRKQFEEESLWTLYSLQEGITSIQDKKRGNGSIQFINSFFSLRGNSQKPDEQSRMVILSGNTKIVFDGRYEITEKQRDGETFKYMTFNKSGNIEDKPDKDAVQFVENYFPGTMISAKIYFDEENLLDESN